MPRASDRAVAYWLFACCFMVFATLVVGGVTRLNRAGLSIVEWQPLLGIIPPLTATDWLVVFAKYQRSPEYLKINLHMPLEEFKFIFWWEWAHRLIGRLIGVVFLLPFLYFWLAGRLQPRLRMQLIGIFFLGGLQGAMGWYMVKSGLADNPHVSQYRLAAHLGLAFLIFGLIAWIGLGLLEERRRAPSGTSLRKMQNAGASLVVLLFVMALSGALIAGSRAGLVYNSFPLMEGRVVPRSLLDLEPVWRNFFENLATVQFDHRVIAWFLFFAMPLFCWRCMRVAAQAGIAAFAVLAMLAVQLALGIATLLNSVPVVLGAAHQAGAMMLFAMLLWLNHVLRTAAVHKASGL